MANVFGTDNDDTIDALDGVTNSADTIYGKNGDDTIFGLGGDDTIFAGDGNDWVIGGDGEDDIFGNAGNDALKGGGGADHLDGGSGNDTLGGGSGADALNGGTGIDTVNYNDSAVGVMVSLQTGQGLGGTAAGDTLFNIENLTGSSYADFLYGNGGDNALNGLEGDDFLRGGAGADAMNGGSGIDTVSYEGSAHWVYVRLDDVCLEGDAEGDMLTSIENAIGSAHYDIMLGNDGANVFNGMDGNDQIAGFGGDDTLYGGDGKDNLSGGAGADQLYGNSGDDSLSGGFGADTMLGGVGNDGYFVDDAGDVVTEHAGQGTLDKVWFDITYSLPAGVEVEIMQMWSATSTSPLDVVGNEFGQTIIGNDGSNTVVGGMGRDVMTGNGAGDVFVWTSTADTGLADTDADVITDFDHAIGDLIAVNPIDADGDAANGDTAFTFVGVVDFAGSNFTGAGQIGYFTTATDTYILLNTTVGGGPTDFQEATIRLTGVHAVDASWFVL